MNNASSVKDAVNMWTRRGELQPIAKKHTVMAAAVCFLCALGLPLCTNEWIALALIGVLFVYVVLTARSPGTVALILVTAFLGVMLGGGFAVGAIFLALVVGTMTGAFLFTASNLPYLTVALPVAAAGVAFILIGDFRIALLALAFLPAAVLLAVATLKGASRTTAICCAEGGLLLVVLVIILVVIRDEAGSLGRDAIIGYVDSLRNETVQAILKVRDQIPLLSGNAADAQTQEVYKQFAEMFSDETVTDVVAQVFNLLPAIAVVVCSIVAFEAQGFLNIAYYNSGLKEVLTPTARYFSMSVPAAVIYSLTFLMMIFIPSSSMAGAVAQNVCLILMPGFCVMGIQSLVLSLSRAHGGMRIFLLLLVASLLCCYTSGALYILAMWGAYGRVMLTIRQKMLEKMGRDSNDHFGGGEGDD